VSEIKVVPVSPPSIRSNWFTEKGVLIGEIVSFTFRAPKGCFNLKVVESDRRAASVKKCERIQSKESKWKVTLEILAEEVTPLVLCFANEDNGLLIERQIITVKRGMSNIPQEDDLQPEPIDVNDSFSANTHQEVETQPETTDVNET
jgi:hypothetical protein